MSPSVRISLRAAKTTLVFLLPGGALASEFEAAIARATRASTTRRQLRAPKVAMREQALCGAAFVQGQLLGGLRRIERESDDCRRDSRDCGWCGCGNRMAWMADALCDLLEPAP